MVFSFSKVYLLCNSNIRSYQPNTPNNNVIINIFRLIDRLRTVYECNNLMQNTNKVHNQIHWLLDTKCVTLTSSPKWRMMCWRWSLTIKHTMYYIWWLSSPRRTTYFMLDHNLDLAQPAYQFYCGHIVKTIEIEHVDNLCTISTFATRTAFVSSFFSAPAPSPA